MTLGGKIKIGKKDDLRIQLSGGNGLGRYAALNFANAAVIKEDNSLKPIPSLNVLYSPVKPLTFGLELMHAARTIEDGTKGSFNRLQFSAQYAFGISSIIT